MIAGIFDSGALPALQRLVQFTSQRHAVLTHNIANLSTPYFQPRDLDPKTFQATLRNAIDQRRASRTPTSGPLTLTDTEQLRFRAGGIEVTPTPTHQNILFHDQNNRDLERTMQHLAENTLAFNAAVELLRNEFNMIEIAIRERV
ncbi:MAG: flagellar basal body rod protein FlgB [Phycisphaeraceae bacterium]